MEADRRPLAPRSVALAAALLALVAPVAPVALVACAGPAASVATPPPEKQSLKLGVAGQDQIALLPLTLAEQLGYFRAGGLDVEIDDLKDDPDTLKALDGGSVDAAAGLYEATIRAQSQGRAVEMVALFDPEPGLVVFVNQKHPEATSVKDLAQLEIGVPALGSAADEVVRYLFSTAGLDPKSARVVAVGTGADATTDLAQDTIQALVAAEPEASAVERSGAGRPLFDTRTAAGTEAVFGGPWPAGGLYLSADFAKQNPRTVQALVGGVVRALRYLRSHSAAEVAAHLPAGVFYPNGDRGVLAGVLARDEAMFSADGRMPAPGPADVVKTLQAADPATAWSAVDLSKTYDNRFAAAVR